MTEKIWRKKFGRKKFLHENIWRKNLWPKKFGGKKYLAEKPFWLNSFLDAGIEIDAAHTSLLLRANQTCDEILKVLNKTEIPVTYSWELNERHYGDLTGASKKDMVKKFGKEQVHAWRRSYDIAPPPINKENAYYDSIQNVSIILVRTKF